MGANTGIVEFSIAIGIMNTKDQLQFHVATPIVTGQALPWRTNINDAASYTAFSIYLQSQNGSTVDRILFPTSGSINVSASSQTVGGKTTAAVAATSYGELDDNGVLLAGGCTVGLTSLSLNLAQGTATFTNETNGDDSGGWIKIIPSGKFGELVPSP